MRLPVGVAPGLPLVGLDERKYVCFPLRPVPVNVLSHVLRLLVGVGQVDIGWVLRALVRVPVLGNAPRVSARF